MEPGKQAFDFPASAIAPESAPVLGFGPTAVRFVGRDQLDAVLLLQTRIQRSAVIGAVSDQALRKRRGEALLDGGFDEFGFMGRSACNPHGDRKTTAVRDCHDLGPFAAACWTNCTAPFFALLKEASMKVSDKSNCPRASKSSAKSPQDLDQRVFPHPALEAAVAGWVRRKLLFRQLRPLRSGAQNP